MALPAQKVAAPIGSPAKRRAPRTNWAPYLLLLPSAILLVVFTLYPMVASGYLALFRADLAHPVPEFIGLTNFKDLLSDSLFQRVLRNTLVFAVGTIPFSVALALFLAVQLNKRIATVPILRAAFFYPTMLPLVSAAAIWNFMYNPSYGLVNSFVGWFGIAGQNWLGTPSLALPAVMFVTIWKDAGYYMIFYLAGMQNLPGDVYEAADLDGASRWEQFRHLTWPLLMPTTLFVSTISFINAFKTVDQVYVMTQGGPSNATNTLLLFIYETTFKYWNTGKGAAASAILILILLAAAVFNHFYVDKKVHYD